MAEANFQNYGASGKIGNQVYYRTSSGKTGVREKVTPKNPKTTAQTLQRVIIAQVGLMYKAFKSICDHSFEGVTMGAKCANKFRKLNADYYRRRAYELNNQGISLDSFYCFQPIGSSRFVPSAAILAQGQLPQVFPTIGSDELGMSVAKVANVSANTYEAVANALRAKRGDQVTFITVNKLNDTYTVEKARVILDPRGVDGSGIPMSAAFLDGSGVIQFPSRRNNGNVYLKIEGTDLQFIAEPANGAVVCACAVILSRKDGDEWLRSNANLVISETNIGSDLTSLWGAVEGSYGAYDIELDNEAYLNNAGEGGSQGSGDNTGGGSYTPAAETYSNSVSINGASQNVAGGSVNVTGSLTSIGITGTNLSESGCVLMKSGVATPVQPTSKTATAITFSNIGGVAGETWRVYKDAGDAQPWFTINVQSGSNSGDAD